MSDGAPVSPRWTPRGRRPRGGLPRLHVVTDDEVLDRDDVLRVAGTVLEAGGGSVALHVRGPGTPARIVWERARRLLPVARAHRALLMVNDRVDVALAVGADGIHLGARSLPVRPARLLVGPEMLVGRSVHGADEVDATEGAELDFLTVGTIFATPSHPDVEGAGAGRITEVASAVPLPLVAIGGIGPERVPEVLAAGAHGVAVLRGVWNAPDPAAAVARYLDALGDLGGSPGRVRPGARAVPASEAP